MLMYDGGDGGESAMANNEVVVNPGVRAFRFLFSVARLRQVHVLSMSCYIIYLMNAIVG